MPSIEGSFADSVARPVCATKVCCNRHSIARSIDGDTRIRLARTGSGYAYGLAKNDAFIDGNKRIALTSMMIFLMKNDVTFSPDPAEATTMILQ